MTRVSSKRRQTHRAYYRCHGRHVAGATLDGRCQARQIAADDLEQAVWQDVWRLLKNPQKIEAEYQRRLRDKPGTTATRGIEPLTRVIDKAQRSLGRRIDLYSEGFLDKCDVEPRLKAAKERLRRLETEAQTLDAQEAEQAEVRLALTRIQDFADQVKQGLEWADWATRRDVIRAVVKRIEINDQEVRIVYRVAPVPFVERPSGCALQDCPKSPDPFSSPVR